MNSKIGYKISFPIALATDSKVYPAETVQLISRVSSNYSSIEDDSIFMKPLRIMSIIELEKFFIIILCGY